ncbi:MAG: hypothetical protein AAGF83_24230 [Cyanobacteria bacterium P01_G01_bin.67]
MIISRDEISPAFFRSLYQRVLTGRRGRNEELIEKAIASYFIPISFETSNIKVSNMLWELTKWLFIPVLRRSPFWHLAPGASDP